MSSKKVVCKFQQKLLKSNMNMNTLKMQKTEEFFWTTSEEALVKRLEVNGTMVDKFAEFTRFLKAC